MTKSLEDAFKRAAQLPPNEQDALADAILREIRSEEEWGKLFSESADVLEHLADEALIEHRSGRTKPLDPEKL